MPESLVDILHATLSLWKKTYGDEPSEVGLSLRFQGFIRRAYEKTGNRVAILVDEYDKPILRAVGNIELQKSFRDTLQAFYGVLKSIDGPFSLRY